MTLKAIPNLELWHRKPDETAEEFGKFLTWLHAAPRGTPDDVSLATRHDWSSRAVEFDARTAPRPREKDRIRAIAKDSLELVGRELGKYVAQSRKQAAIPTIEARDLRAIVELSKIADLVGGVDEDVDLSEISTEDLRKLQEARRILSGRK